MNAPVKGLRQCLSTRGLQIVGGCWDMEVCVYNGSQSSSFRRQHAGALWLRAVASHYQQQQQQAAEELPVAPREQIVFEAQIADAESAGVCRGAAQWRSERAHVKIKSSAARRDRDSEDRDRSCLTLELWEVEAYSYVGSSDTDNDGFLSFVGAARVDLKRWKQALTACLTRWYPMQSGRSAKRDAWSSESEFEEREERLLPDAVYFQATLVDSSLTKEKKMSNEATLEAIAEPPPSSFSPPSVNAEFQLVFPSQIVARSRRFLATRVGEIIHEVRTSYQDDRNTEYLQELLPVVLYGEAQLRRAPAALQNLILVVCVDLIAATRKIKTEHAKLTQQKAKLQRQRGKMELRRRNLRRELQVLDSSLDGMRLLLQQVDPNCLELFLQQDL